MRAYLASFHAQPGKEIAGRLGVTLGTTVAASAVLLGITALTLVLCAILLGFALVVPEILTAVGGIVAIVVRPKTDVTVEIFAPLLVFCGCWIWFASHFFHF